MKKQKLAIVNVFFPPQEIGGATRVVADQFEVLRNNYSDQFDLVIFTTEEAHAEPHHNLTVYPYHGVLVYKVNSIFRKNMDWQPRDNIMGNLFDKFLQYEQPDLIHFHCIQRLTGSVIENTLERNIPYWVTVHDAWWISDYQFLVDQNGTVYPEGHPDPYIEIPMLEDITLEQSLERRLYLRDMLCQAQRVLTVSECFANIYRQNGVSQIQVIKNGISNQINWQPKKTAYSEKVICAHIGGMSDHKGYFLFKKAIEGIKLKNIEILVVDLSHPEGYQHQTFWGDTPVKFIGRVNKNNIVKLYQKIDVLFAPSIWPESFGLVTREAIACGCWVVTSNIGGIGEDVLFKKNGYVIKPTLKELKSIFILIDDNHIVYKEQSHCGLIRFVKEQVDELVATFEV